MSEGAYRAGDVLRVPGLLSLCRLPLAVLFPFALGRPAWALGVLAGAAATDVLDGWTARRLHQETATGAVLDGVMDKLFVGVVLVTLVIAGSLTWLDVALLGSRELLEALLVGVVLLFRPRRLGEHRAASVLGKLATVLQFATVTLVVVRGPYVPVALGVTAGCGALAAIAYARRELGERATARPA